MALNLQAFPSSATTTPRASTFDSLLAQVQPANTTAMGATTTPARSAFDGLISEAAIRVDPATGQAPGQGFIRRLIERVANAPASNLPTMLAPLAPFVGEDVTVRDYFENVQAGARKGSLLLPDSKTEPENADGLIQGVYGLAAAVAEGAGAERIALKGLVHLAEGTRAGSKIASLARKALDLYGQDPSFSLTRKAVGSTALAATIEAPLQAAALAQGDVTAREAATGLGLVTGAGFLLGGAVAGLDFAGSLPQRLARAEQASAEALTPELLEQMAVRADAVSLAGEVQGTRIDFRAMARKLVQGETLSESERQAAQSFQRTFALEKEAGSVAAESAAVVGDPANGALFPRVEAGLRATEGEISGEALDELRRQRPSSVPEDVQARFRESVVRQPKPGFLENALDRLSQTAGKVASALTYEKEMSRYPSFERDMLGNPVEGLTLADDFRGLALQRTRAGKYAADRLGMVFEQIRAIDPKHQKEAFEQFEDLVFLRDLKETAERGLSTGSMSVQDITLMLADLEARAPQASLYAAGMHRLIVNDMRDQLVKRGRLNEGAGYSNYVPHVVIQTLAEAQELATTGKKLEVAYPTLARLRSGALKEPSRQYTRQRGGTTRSISGDYIEVMSRALTKFSDDNAIDDFLAGVEKGHAIPREKLSKDLTSLYGAEQANRLLDTLDEFESVVLPNGERLQTFNPRGKTLFPTNAVDDTSKRVVEGLLAGQELSPDAKVTFRKVMDRGADKTLILPQEISQRLERFHEGNLVPGPIRAVNAITGTFKLNAITYGFAQYFQLNLLGDAVNVFRSNPKTFSKFPLAIKTVLAQYRLPLATTQQLVAGGVGGALGDWTSGELTDDDPEMLTRAASILIGAGLGYAVGTRGFTIGDTPIARSLGIANKQLVPPKVGTKSYDPGLSVLYQAMDEVGAANNGFITNMEEMGLQVLGPSATNHPSLVRSGMQRASDTVTMFLSGKPVGQPFNILGARSAFETFEKLNAERENIFRMASYLQNLEDGMHPKLAVKRANESLVDYGRMTDFEARYLRGFLLPFYSFYKGNTVNWIKSIAGQDVGGRPKVALMAIGALAAFDVVAQQWNERFFPEVENKLDPRMRKSFHIIAGDPTTGEAHLNKRGEPIIVGLEMPYESALEVLGLARPGVLLSELGGVDLGREASLIGRVKEAEGWDTAGAAVKAPIAGLLQRGAQLLNPILRVPLELAGNENWYFESPIVPNRFTGTTEERDRTLRYLAESYFRQLREGRRLVQQIEQGRFNPVSSPFGLGIPIRNPDLNRNVQGRLHEMFDSAESNAAEKRVDWMKDLDELFYTRGNFEVPEPTESDQVMRMLNDLPVEQQDAALRYYLNRSAKGSIQRRWDAMSWQERAELAKVLAKDPASESAFWFYSLGGKDITDPGMEQMLQQAEGMPSLEAMTGVR